MDGWKAATVIAGLAAGLASILAGVMIGQTIEHRMRIEELSHRIVVLESQHSPPPYGHAPASGGTDAAGSP